MGHGPLRTVTFLVNVVCSLIRLPWACRCRLAATGVNVEAERAGGRGDARVGIAADADGHRSLGHLGRLRPRRYYQLVTFMALEEQ